MMGAGVRHGGHVRGARRRELAEPVVFERRGRRRRPRPRRRCGVRRQLLRLVRLVRVRALAAAVAAAVVRLRMVAVPAVVRLLARLRRERFERPHGLDARRSKNLTWLSMLAEMIPWSLDMCALRIQLVLVPRRHDVARR